MLETLQSSARRDRIKSTYEDSKQQSPQNTARNDKSKYCFEKNVRNASQKLPRRSKSVYYRDCKGNKIVFTPFNSEHETLWTFVRIGKNEFNIEGIGERELQGWDSKHGLLRRQDGPEEAMPHYVDIKINCRNFDGAEWTLGRNASRPSNGENDRL